MEYIKNKRGVSDVITTVLIILLVLAAVAIIGGIFLRNIGQAGSKIETSTGCVELDIQPVSCVLSGTGAGTLANVLVQRGSRGSSLEISKLAAVVEKVDGATATANAVTTPDALATTSITVPNVGDNAKNARVSATLKGSDGSEQTCELTNVVVECKKAGSGGSLKIDLVASDNSKPVGTVMVFNKGSGYVANTVIPYSCASSKSASFKIDSVDSNGGLGTVSIVTPGEQCSGNANWPIP